MKKVRLGLIGTSWWTDVVFPGFALARNAEVTWIAARTAEKARAFAEAHGIPHWSGDYNDVLAASDVDAVFIGVPNFLHDELARAALNAGKHVLQEKPMALSAGAAESQAELASSKGLVLMPDQETRLADGARDLPELIANRIGPLRKVVLGMTMNPGEWGGWRGDKSLSGGTLFEMAIHQMDFARWLWKRNPVSVWAVGEDTATHDMTLVFDYGDGDSAVIDYCWRSIGFTLRAECYGERGYVKQEMAIPFGPGRQVIVTEEGREETQADAALQGPHTFQRVLEGFADSILKGSPLPIPTEDGVWAVRMAEAARESLRTGGTVHFLS